MNRTRAREQAFCLIFSLDIQKEEMMDRLEEAKEEWQKSHESKDRENIAYIDELVNGIYQNKETIDATIQKYLKEGWSIQRISKVSLAVLRVAVYEITSTQTPDKAAINEAVNLTKKYDDETMASFVNGVLAGVMKDRECLSE